MASEMSGTPLSEDQEFLAAYDASQFPHPSLTVDVVLLTANMGKLQALLANRTQPPQQGWWAVPGGFVQMRESLEDAASRVLADEVGIAGIFLEQLYTFGAPDRDPRTRIVTVSYYALVDAARLTSDRVAQSDVKLTALRVDWEGETGGPARAIDDQGNDLPLAFDHAQILGAAVQRLRGKLDYAPIGFELLPERFTLRQLQEIHETILGRRLNKDSFRRRMLASGLTVATGEREADVGHRPAELYRFHENANNSEGTT